MSKSSVPPWTHEGSVRRSFRAHPSALHQIRTFVRELAASCHFPQRLTEDLVLAVSEASANAMLHTNTPQIDVLWRNSDEHVEVQVDDHGMFKRRVPLPELDGRGRGIPLMMALMDEVTIREGTPGRPGTTVRLVKYRHA